MSKRLPLARISCTIPEDVLIAADRLAAREQRSRSWVISEALRRYTAQGTVAPRPVRAPAEPVHVPDDAAGERAQQLRDDLRLPPAERLARAEELMAFARANHPRRSGAQIIGFETLDDFSAWKAAQRSQP